MNERNLIRKINRLYPLSSSEPWDFPGFQCGMKSPEKEVKRVFLCLDFTEECLPEAKRFQPDLILTHHPFFFGKRKEVFLSDPKKIELEKQILELHVPLYSYHTNFDKGKGGINDTLLSLLGFSCGCVAEDGLMRLVHFDFPLSMENLIDRIKDRLSLPFLLYLKGNERPIQTIALVAGGDSEDYRNAMARGADCFLSGDCPHHRRLEIRRYGMNYIELPHEVEEVSFLTGMGKVLKSLDSNLEVNCFSFEKYFEIR